MLRRVVEDEYGINPTEPMRGLANGRVWECVSGDARYILKLHEGVAGERVEGFTRVVEAVHAAGLHPGLIANRHGGFFSLGEDGVLVSLMRRESGEVLGAEHAREAGQALAGLHRVLANIDVARLDNHFERDGERVAQAASKYGFEDVTEAVRRGGRYARGAGSQCLHGDPHLGNMFRRSDGRVLFLDFDSVCTARVEMDIALCGMRFSFEDRANFLNGYDASYDAAVLPDVALFCVMQRLKLILDLNAAGDSSAMWDLAAQRKLLDRCKRWARAHAGSTI